MQSPWHAAAPTAFRSTAGHYHPAYTAHLPTAHIPTALAQQHKLMAHHEPSEPTYLCAILPPDRTQPSLSCTCCFDTYKPKLRNPSLLFRFPRKFHSNSCNSVRKKREEEWEHCFLLNKQRCTVVKLFLYHPGTPSAPFNTGICLQPTLQKSTAAY